MPSGALVMAEQQGGAPMRDSTYRINVTVLTLETTFGNLDHLVRRLSPQCEGQIGAS